jgi:hypothetical protein
LAPEIVQFLAEVGAVRVSKPLGAAAVTRPFQAVTRKTAPSNEQAGRSPALPAAVC